MPHRRRPEWKLRSRCCHFSKYGKYFSKVQYIHIMHRNMLNELQDRYLLKVTLNLQFCQIQMNVQCCYNCVVSPSKTELPIAPPSSSLTTVNHCVHTHSHYACIKGNFFAYEIMSTLMWLNAINCINLQFLLVFLGVILAMMKEISVSEC